MTAPICPRCHKRLVDEGDVLCPICADRVRVFRQVPADQQTLGGSA